MSHGVNSITISSNLVRKNHDVNEVIKKVNNLLKTLHVWNMVLEHGTNILCHNLLQYLKIFL